MRPPQISLFRIRYQYSALNFLGQSGSFCDQCTVVASSLEDAVVSFQTSLFSAWHPNAGPHVPVILEAARKKIPGGPQVLITRLAVNEAVSAFNDAPDGNKEKES